MTRLFITKGEKAMMREFYYCWTDFWEKRRMKKFREELRWWYGRGRLQYMEILRANGLPEIEVVHLGEIYAQMIDAACDGEISLFLLQPPSIQGAPVQPLSAVPISVGPAWVQ